MTCPSEIRRDVFDQLRVPDQSVPELERVRRRPDRDFGTLRSEILRRVPETLIPDHRLQRPVAGKDRWPVEGAGPAS